MGVAGWRKKIEKSFDDSAGRGYYTNVSIGLKDSYMGRQNLINTREAEILSILINGEKYGREIRDEYEKRTGRSMPFGSLYTTLERIDQKGYIRSRLGDSTHARGGNRRKYYRLTASGTAALNAFELWAASIAGRALNAAT